MFRTGESSGTFDRTLLDGRPLKQGFLVKHKCIRGDWTKAAITNNWRKRWFIISNTHMIYFKLPSETKPKGWFDLTGCRVEMAEERSGKPLCFAVHTNQKCTFLMLANTTDALASWLAVIKQVAEPQADQTPRNQPATPSAVPPLLSTSSTVDVLGRPKPPPITLTAKRVRFKTDVQGAPPAPRHGHTAFLVDGVRMLVFGGEGRDGSYGDVNVFNLGSAAWDPYSITGRAPSPRMGHSATTMREFAYVFGGCNGSMLTNDLFELNMDELEWKQPQAAGTPPAARFGHGAAIVDGSMFVIGGKGADGQTFNDVHALDLVSWQWNCLMPNNSQADETHMPPRAHQACGAFDENIVLFGGVDANGELSNSVFMFGATDQKWTMEQPKGVPPTPRKGMAFAAFKNRVLFLVGGEAAGKDGQGLGLVNELWALDVIGYTWIQIMPTGNPLESMAWQTLCIKDQVLYMFGGRQNGGLCDVVSVLKVADQGLPSINLRGGAARPSFVQRMQLKSPTLQDFDVGVTLGTGSFGRVHCVRHKKTGQFYAMKVLKKKEILHLNQVDHINAEREVLSSISHPHVVNFCGAFQDSRKLYIVMEFVSGGEFFTHLRKAGRFKEDVARFYAAEILSALEYLHSSNIVYRDLKPENILLDDKGHAKITDFGFAKQVEFRTWTLCGTPEYLAPEIILSKGHWKPADYWALGILTFEMLAGYPPFYDDEPLRIYQKILQGQIKWPYHFSNEAKDFISQLLVADVNKRLGSGKKGAQAIKDHPWFKSINWQEISTSAQRAPIQPGVKADGDTSNFERYPEDQDDDWPECTDAENSRFVGFG